MIPQGGTLTSGDAVTAVEQPSKTYQLDLTAKRIVGTVDGLEAVKQAAYKALRTERFGHLLIYTGDYGAELANLVGQRAFVESELRRRIREALVQDDRIADVVDFHFVFGSDSVQVDFTIVSTQGNFKMATGVVTGV